MTPARAATFASALALIGACRHVEEHAGPGGIPYACADGRTARIFYDGGDPTRAPARLRFGGHEFTLAPAPAMNGLRYVSETGLGEGYRLVWWAEGDAALLSELASDPAAEPSEREIVRCARVREADGPTPHAPHGG
jgi:hypothetical protein